MKKYVIILFLLSITFSNSQTKVDSLETELSQTSIDTVKIKILHKFFSEYQYTDLPKAEETVLKSIRLSKESKNQKLLAKSFNHYGEFLQSQSKYDLAMSYHNKALLISEKDQFNNEMSDALVNIGLCYQRKKEFNKAIKFLERNLTLCKKTDYTEKCTGISYSILGLIYMSKNEFSESMQYFMDAREIHLRLGNQKELGMTLANIGMNFAVINNQEKANGYLYQADSILKEINYKPGIAFVKTRFAAGAMHDGDFDRAELLYLDALKNYDEIGNMDRVGSVNYTLGVIFYHRKKFNKALDYYMKKLAISEKLKDSIGMSTVLKAIGSTHYMLKDMDAAKMNYKKALLIAKKSKYGINIMDAHKALADIYKKEGNYLEAYGHEKLYGNVKDSLYTKERRDYANEIEAKYQNKEKAIENALLTKDNDFKALKLKQRVNERNVIIVFAFILLLLGFLLYNQYRIKQKANKELKELDRLKSNFFANISHEFRTPLTLIKGPIEQLEQNPDEKLSMDNIKMIRRNTNRVLNLVNQLLDLSKIDEGNLPLEPTEIDIYKSLRTATSSFNSLAAQRHIDYKVKIPQTVLWASFDRDKLDKIVYNLLSNAFKFSEDYAIISFDAYYDEHGLQILVSDSGRGIPDEKIPFIFDRFYQADISSTKDNEGSGIGLSLSKELVELMDGTITVSSELNKGSFFTVVLPILEIKTGNNYIETTDSNVKRKLSKQEAFVLAKKDERNLPSILLVEDNNDMRHFIKEQLIKFYKVIEAINGQDGHKKAIANPPDLIITDLMMPKMDGIELCKMLKTNVNTSHIPIIMLTAKAGIDNKIEGLETGADDYLIKPFDVSELRVRVKNLITQRENLRTLFSDKTISIDPKKVTVMSIDQKFLEQVLNLFEEKYAEPDFGVPQMQEFLGMSKTQLHRKLKALTNEAPGELLRNFRLKKAAQLISQKADTVTQIAYMVGFNNLSYFAKCFKELYGISPSSYPTINK